jgi:AraC family transcriptional regulator
VTDASTIALGAAGRGAARRVIAAPDPALYGAALPTVEFRPPDIAQRQVAAWHGLGGEVVRTIRPEAFEVEHCSAGDLLIAYESAERLDGETMIDGLPRSTLRNLTRKLVFVPAGFGFREWQEPRGFMQAIYLHLDRHSALRHQERTAAAAREPRLFFESAVLWQTALKLKALIEAGPSASRLYAEALGIVLMHELLDADGRVLEARARGGLASRQRRAVMLYIEACLAEEISLATLASVAQLSPYHFSRAFKESFGEPPHRYHIRRRIDRAKALLADRDRSLLHVAIALGFSGASSFCVAFRKITGQTPSAYRRSLI